MPTIFSQRKEKMASQMGLEQVFIRNEAKPGQVGKTVSDGVTVEYDVFECEDFGTLSSPAPLTQHELLASASGLLRRD